MLQTLTFEALKRNSTLEFQKFRGASHDSNPRLLLERPNHKGCSGFLRKLQRKKINNFGKDCPLRLQDYLITLFPFLRSLARALFPGQELILCSYLPTSILDVCCRCARQRAERRAPPWDWMRAANSPGFHPHLPPYHLFPTHVSFALKLYFKDI